MLAQPKTLSIEWKNTFPCRWRNAIALPCTGVVFIALFVASTSAAEKKAQLGKILGSLKLQILLATFRLPPPPFFFVRYSF